MAEGCYLCGGPSETRDHVPPKGFFLRPRPNNLITVPCCRQCNKKWSDDDEAVRAYLTAIEGCSPAGQKIWEEAVIGRTVANSEGFRRNMLSKVKEFAVRCQLGFYTVPGFEVPWERVGPFMVRVTKGLLRTHYPTFDYSSSFFAVSYPTEDQTERLVEILTGTAVAEIGHETFFYRYRIFQEDQTGIWYLGFYERHGFFVVHTTNAELAAKFPNGCA